MTLKLEGIKFSKLLVIKRIGSNKNKQALWLCQCDCGNLIREISAKLNNGRKKSCGCINLKHGAYYTKLYNIWSDMKGRCLNSKHHAYEIYGARNIKIYHSWINDFSVFRDWALDNGYKEGLIIDREDVNGNYEPGNCRWVTYKISNNNSTRTIKITAFGESKTLREWIDDPRCRITYAALRSRLKTGWPAEKAITFSYNKTG